ncbi:MAG: hypothetical protein OEZ54_12305 [Gemmatimonadota bacterium]|nr:hypothetical protein [Gemmatimonadota bacterium]
MRRFSFCLVLGLTVPSVSAAQENRLEGRLSDATRLEIDAVLDSVRTAGLPVEPLIDRALEGAAKRAPEDLIVRAVRRLWGELDTAKQAFGEAASTAELTAGAAAIRAGATQEDLAQLRALRPEQSVTMAAAVLADLVAVGVPADTAIVAVLALAPAVSDSDYLAFRRNVEQDISLGASPSAALDVWLQAEALNSPVDGFSANDPGTTGSTPPTKRKP